MLSLHAIWGLLWPPFAEVCCPRVGSACLSHPSNESDLQALDCLTVAQCRQRQGIDACQHSVQRAVVNTCVESEEGLELSRLAAAPELKSKPLLCSTWACLDVCAAFEAVLLEKAEGSPVFSAAGLVLGCLGRRCCQHAAASATAPASASCGYDPCGCKGAATPDAGGAWRREKRRGSSLWLCAQCSECAGPSVVSGRQQLWIG